MPLPLVELQVFLHDPWPINTFAPRRLVARLRRHGHKSLFTCACCREELALLIEELGLEGRDQSQALVAIEGKVQCLGEGDDLLRRPS